MEEVHIVPPPPTVVERWYLANFGLFAVFFGFHIVFAALDFDLAFSLVALLITGQILLFGPISVVLEGASVRAQRRATNRIGALLSFPLCIGLAWAYGGMAWSWSAFLPLVVAWGVVHLTLDRQLSKPLKPSLWVG
jgi:hypothetical protein